MTFRSIDKKRNIRFSALIIISLSISIVKAQPLVNYNLISATAFESGSDLPEERRCVFNSISFAMKADGSKKWQAAFNLPEYGIDVMHGYFFNRKELGDQFSFVPYLLYQSKASENWGVLLKAGIGIGYFTQTYNRITNPRNFYVGSHFTNSSIIQTALWFKLSKVVTISLGLQAFHSSNGHYQLPNLGMNMAGITLGAKYNFQSTAKKAPLDSFPECQKKFNVTVKGGFGVHEFGSFSKPTGGPKYATYHLSGYVSKPFRTVSRWQAGMSVGYYADFYDFILNQQLYSTQQRLRSLTGMLFVGHEFMMGKFGVCVQAGVYFFNPFYKDLMRIRGENGTFFSSMNSINGNRLGFNYYPFKRSNTLNTFEKQLSIGVFIKTNFAQADFFEYALAYTF